MKNLLLVCIIFILLGCKTKSSENRVYESELLCLDQISPNAFVHISYLQTQDFGNVACNGVVFFDNEEAVVVDAPTDDATAHELIAWIENKMNSTLKAVISTHFHIDCTGGLPAFHDHNIPSYANELTIKLSKQRNQNAPEHGFNGNSKIYFGDKYVQCEFLGEGHTRDNIVCYFPSENVLFGGCLIKALGAGKGNLEDANTDEWSNTVHKVATTFPSAAVVVPGHGMHGDHSLLNYTMEMFELK